MELSFVLFLNHLSFPYLDTLTVSISNEMFLAVLCICSLITVYTSDPQNRRIIITSIIGALLLHFFITEFLLKGIFSDILFRARPYMIDPAIHQIGTRFTDSSFPSSHMVSTLSILSVYFFFYKKYIPHMLAFMLLMAFARIHNGMHYPSDVLAGSVLGILYGVSALYTTKHVSRSFNHST